MASENSNTDSDLQLDDLLSLGARLQRQGLDGSTLPPFAQEVRLAAFVAYQLPQGGFAQLLFNAQGAISG